MVTGELGDRGEIGGDNGAPASHCLCDWKPKPLHLRRIRKCQGALIERRQLLIGRLLAELNTTIPARGIEERGGTPTRLTGKHKAYALALGIHSVQSREQGSKALPCLPCPNEEQVRIWTCCVVPVGLPH